MRRRRLTPLVLGAAMTCVALAAAGCGSDDDSATPASWASGVCSAITTWQSALTSAADSVRSDPTQDTVESAADDAKSATETLESDLDDLGKPDTDAGDQAKDLVAELSTSLQDGADAIDEAIKDVSDASGVPAAVATVTSTLTTMKTVVDTTVTNLQGLDAQGELKDAFTSASECDSLTGSGS